MEFILAKNTYPNPTNHNQKNEFLQEQIQQGIPTILPQPKPYEMLSIMHQKKRNPFRLMKKNTKNAYVTLNTTS
jgi:hypothetical protein